MDNLTGTKVLGRSLRVDHCEKYRLPKELLEKEEQLAGRTEAGHAYQDKELANQFSVQQGQDLFAKLVPAEAQTDRSSKEDRKEAKRKRKEERYQHRQEREDKRQKKEEKRREKRAMRYQDERGDSREKRHKKKRKKVDYSRED